MFCSSQDTVLTPVPLRIQCLARLCDIAHTQFQKSPPLLCTWMLRPGRTMCSSRNSLCLLSLTLDLKLSFYLLDSCFSYRSPPLSFFSRKPSGPSPALVLWYSSALAGYAAISSDSAYHTVSIRSHHLASVCREWHSMTGLKETRVMQVQSRIWIQAYRIPNELFLLSQDIFQLVRIPSRQLRCGRLFQ